ncbi:MAG: hypothetical protein A2Y18_06540 [Clostridiales bacterium GWD2_32_19]|nr:MAG: hypothetical protein A2Y18_06540 [Clostridiales bacterium GWD2_32_19]
MITEDIQSIIGIAPILRDFIFDNFNVERGKQKLTFSQEKTLMFVKTSNDVTMSEIAKNIGIEKGSFSILVEKMIKSEYLIRENSIKDRRVVYLRLTEKGDTYANEIISHLKNKIGKKLNYLSEDEKKELLSHVMGIKKLLNVIKHRQGNVVSVEKE